MTFYLFWVVAHVFLNIGQSPSGRHVFHGEIMNHVWRPELHQNVPHLSPISPASTEFRKIPWKHRNSAEMGKFRSSAQNSVFRTKHDDTFWILVKCGNKLWLGLYRSTRCNQDSWTRQHAPKVIGRERTRYTCWLTTMGVFKVISTLFGLLPRI